MPSTVSLSGLRELLLLQPRKLLHTHATVRKLVLLLLTALFRWSVDVLMIRHGSTDLLHLLVLGGGVHHSRYVIRKPELFQSLGDVITRYGLLRFLFGYLVCLGGDECDELDAALDEQVAGFLGKADACCCWQDLAYDLLHGCLETLVFESA